MRMKLGIGLLYATAGAVFFGINGTMYSLGCSPSNVVTGIGAVMWGTALVLLLWYIGDHLPRRRKQA